MKVEGVLSWYILSAVLLASSTVSYAFDVEEECTKNARLAGEMYDMTREYTDEYAGMSRNQYMQREYDKCIRNYEDDKRKENWRPEPRQPEKKGWFDGWFD